MENKVAVTVIATGFENTQDGAVPSSKKAPVDDTVVSYGVFQDVMNSKIPLGGAATEQLDIPKKEERAETIDKQALFSKENATESTKENSASNISLSDALHDAIRNNKGIVPPSDFTRREGDLTQPACWRKLNGLSRSIDLTDD